jgi:hypothetical protein
MDLISLDFPKEFYKITTHQILTTDSSYQMTLKTQRLVLLTTMVFLLVSFSTTKVMASKKFEEGILHGMLLAKAHHHHKEYIPVHEPVHHVHSVCHDDHY